MTRFKTLFSGAAIADIRAIGEFALASAERIADKALTSIDDNCERLKHSPLAVGRTVLKDLTLRVTNAPDFHLVFYVVDKVTKKVGIVGVVDGRSRYALILKERGFELPPQPQPRRKR